MTESIAAQLESSDMREELSDDLERYVRGASDEIVRLAYATEATFCSLGAPEDFRKQVHEVLMETIYLPLMMGEDRYSKKL